MNIGVSVVGNSTSTWQLDYTVDDPSGLYPNPTLGAPGVTVYSTTNGSSTATYATFSTPVAAIRLTMNALSRVGGKGRRRDIADASAWLTEVGNFACLSVGRCGGRFAIFDATQARWLSSRCRRALPSLPVRFATVSLETVAFLRARLTVALARVTTMPKPEKIRFCQTLAAILAH
jgi:hypothetical protein